MARLLVVVLLLNSSLVLNYFLQQFLKCFWFQLISLLIDFTYRAWKSNMINKSKFAFKRLFPTLTILLQIPVPYSENRIIEITIVPYFEEPTSDHYSIFIILYKVYFNYGFDSKVLLCMCVENIHIAKLMTKHKCIWSSYFLV